MKNNHSALIEFLQNNITIAKQIPEIVYIGDNVLRQKASPIDIFTGQKIDKKLIKVLKKHHRLVGYGRGLAAPQIGISSQVFVTLVDNDVKIFINPTIINYSNQKSYYKEGCISCGGLCVNLKRPQTISINYTNQDGNVLTEDFSGFMARLIQHEYDHLQGLIIVDKAEQGSISLLQGDPIKETFTKA